MSRDERDLSFLYLIEEREEISYINADLYFLGLIGLIIICLCL